MGPGGVGIWTWDLRDVDAGTAGACAAELEGLGFTALWIPGFLGEPPGPLLTPLLAASDDLVVATGILNIWHYAPADVADLYARLHDESNGRFLLGLGVGHERNVNTDELPDRYRRPYSEMVAFLDGLDESDPAVPRDGIVLAALGPRMLALSQARAIGAHPYFTPPEHTRVARELMGPDAYLAPEQMILFDADPASARATARAVTERYLALPNYANNLRRLGFAEEDLAGAGSDQLVDAIVAWGDDDAIAARVSEHFDAGADHVCVQVLGGVPGEPARALWRHAASVLTGR